MSDYEGEGWNTVDLSVEQESIKAGPTALVDFIAPRGRLISDISSIKPKTDQPEKQPREPRPIKRFHPHVQNIQPRTYHGTGGRSIETSFAFPHDNKASKFFELYLERPDSPRDVYELDIPWKKLLNAIPESGEQNSRDIARRNLDTISLYSEVFIRTPDPESTKVEIWGTQEHCNKAKERLKAWESHLRATGVRQNKKTWVKEHAFDGRREDRRRQEIWAELEDTALQEAEDSYFPFEAYLVWPADYDLDSYIKKYEPATLKEIAREFRCRFKHERKGRPRFTKVQAETEASLLSVYQRLINLVKEMIAQKKRGIHGNFCNPPSAGAYKDQVVTSQDTQLYRAMLSGTEISESKAEEWLWWAKGYQRQNRAEFSTSMDAFFQTLHVSQCHIRLRVSFGDIYLRQFPKAKNGGLVFEFDEFLAMLSERRTELSEPVIKAPQGDITSFVDKLFAMEQFRYPEHSYRQVFEFKGTDSTNRLRLEIEMQPGHDFDEPQVCGQRWLTFKTYSQNENVLGLKMMDFERPGYMIRADAFDLFTNDSIIKDMEAFRSAVGFKPSRDGIKAYPRLRSTFPNHPKLVAVSEFVSVKFQFKDTDGIAEVRRQDIFSQDVGARSQLPNSTQFDFLYYYPEWDSLLGELSNVKPGGDVDWNRNLTTFFPTHSDPDRPRALPRGFKTFVKEVEEIQLLLGQALSESKGE